MGGQPKVKLLKLSRSYYNEDFHIASIALYFYLSCTEFVYPDSGIWSLELIRTWLGLGTGGFGTKGLEPGLDNFIGYAKYDH